MATAADIQIDPEGSGPKVDTIEIEAGTPPIERQVVVIGDPDVRGNRAKIANTTPNSTDQGVVVRPVSGATATLAAFHKVVDSGGVNVAGVDASGNQKFALGSPLDKTSVVSLSDWQADRKLEINSEDSAFSFAFPSWIAKVRTAVAALTAGRHAAPTVTPQGSLWVGEKAAAGTPVRSQPTIDAVTLNGVQLAAAHTTRRRVVVINRGTVDCYLEFGNITAGSTAGILLVGVKGYQLTFYCQAEIRATCVSGTQQVDVVQEVL